MSKVNFNIQAAILDEFAHLGDLSKDPKGVQVVLSAIKSRDDLADYFFTQRPSASWAPLLLEQGFFSSPPEPEKVENGYNIPVWRLSHYLADVAASVPEVVIRVVNEIHTKNALVCADLVKALSRIPADLVPQTLDKVIVWINANLIGWGFSTEIFDLVTYLASNNETGGALQLFRVLSEPLPSSYVVDYQGVISQAEARSRFEQFRSVERFWSEPLHALGSKVPQQLSEILEANLIKAIELENIVRGRPADTPDDWSRHAIEDTDQDRLQSDYKYNLLLALRDTLAKWVQSGSESAIEFVRRLLQHKYSLLKRLAIHLIRENAEFFKGELSDLLTSKDNLDDVHIHHEFFLLLASGFPLLAREHQHTVLANILRGPDETRTRELAEWANKHRGANIDDYTKNFIGTWTRDRLWMIGEYLPDDAKANLRELTSEFGEPKHPEFLGWSTGAFWVQNRSPISGKEFASMSTEQILAFIRSWKPAPESQIGPEVLSHEGLAEALTEFLLSPEYGGGLIERLVDLPPVYASKFYLRLEEEVKAGRFMHWHEVLDLATAISNLQTNLGTENDEYVNWRGVKTEIAGLIETALKSDKVDLASDVMTQMRDVLLKLIYDADPDATADNPQEGWVGAGDPLTIALNHVRPRALTALFEYAHRWANVYKAVTQQTGQSVSRWEFEVKQAITDKLDRIKDPSWSVHCLYGLYLPLLYWLDKAWLDEHLDDILPESIGEESTRYFMAAWDSYVLNNVHAWTFEYLRQKYVHGILNLSEGKVTHTHLEPDKHLAAHLLSEYLHTDYDLQAPAGSKNLLRLFMEKAPPRSRGSAIWLLWHWLSDDERLRKRSWSKVRALWAWRTQEASIKSFPVDFADEFTWFAYLPKVVHDIETIESLWPLLQGLLPYIARGERGAGWMVIEEYLALAVEHDPVNVIKYYRLMHEQPSVPKWLFYGNESEKIIRGVLAAPETRDQAIELADFLARRKNFRFLELVKTYKG